MSEKNSLLLERIEKAIKIAGSQKKLCEMAGISPVILSRLKGYHKGTSTLPQKRENLSVKTLQKLADAIDEDITFFTNADYGSQRIMKSENCATNEQSNIIAIIRKNLKKTLEQKQMTQSEFADKLDISNVYLSDILNGKKGDSLKMPFAEKMAKILNISLIDLISEAPIIENIKRRTNTSIDYDFIKFYDVKASAGYGELVEVEPSRMMPVERSFINKLGVPATDLAVVEVAGDSMEPTLRSGDLVIVYVPSIAVDFIAGVYVLRDQWGLKVKRLDRDKYGNLTVISDNSRYDKIIYAPDEEGTMVTIVGRVVGRLSAM